MKYIINYYLLGQILLIVIAFVLISLISRNRITHCTARWIMTGMNLLEGIPAVLAVGWYFGVFITIVQISIQYYIFWGYEQMEIELAKKRLREEKAASGS